MVSSPEQNINESTSPQSTKSDLPEGASQIDIKGQQCASNYDNQPYDSWLDGRLPIPEEVFPSKKLPTADRHENGVAAVSSDCVTELSSYKSSNPIDIPSNGHIGYGESTENLTYNKLKSARTNETRKSLALDLSVKNPPRESVVTPCSEDTDEPPSLCCPSTPDGEEPDDLDTSTPEEEDVLVIDSPDYPEIPIPAHFMDEEHPETSSMVDDVEESTYPRTIPELPSDVEDNTPVENSSLQLPTTLDDEDLPEETATLTDDKSFWRYNKLTKGPKPQVKFDVDVKHPEENPHAPIVFNDPVYDKSQPLLVRHPGRARLGEGNDITANPQKLIKLGKELEVVQNKMAALGDGKKNKREKMRCSSRLCRLKRIANHEANKIKMAGLEEEREEISSVIKKVNHKMKSSPPPEQGYLAFLNRLKEDTLHTTIAGETGDYVNNVLKSVTEYHVVPDSDSD